MNDDPKPEVVYKKLGSPSGPHYLLYVRPYPIILNPAPMTKGWEDYPPSETWLMSFSTEDEAKRTTQALQPHARGLMLLLETAWNTPPGSARAAAMKPVERLKSRILKDLGIPG